MCRQTHMEPNQTFRQVQAPVPSNVVDHGTSNTFSHAFILLLRLILLYMYIYVYVCVFDFQEVSRLGIPNSNGLSFSPYFQSGGALGWPSGRLPIGIPRMLLSLGLCLEIGRWEGFLRALRLIRYP